MDDSQIFTRIIPATQWMVDNIIAKSKSSTGVGCYNITHGVFKDNQHIGHLSIGAVPLVTLWMTEQAKARDTQAAVQFAENYVVSILNLDNMIVLSEPTCKLAPYIERVGYEKLPYNQVHIKDLKFKIWTQARLTQYHNTSNNSSKP